MGMYFKDKTEVYKVRFTPEQSDYIERLSKALNCSKSQAVRFIVDTVRMGEVLHENKQTNLDDKL